MTDQLLPEEMCDDTIRAAKAFNTAILRCDENLEEHLSPRQKSQVVVDLFAAMEVLSDQLDLVEAAIDSIEDNNVTEEELGPGIEMKATRGDDLLQQMAEETEFTPGVGSAGE